MDTHNKASRSRPSTGAYLRVRVDGFQAGPAHDVTVYPPRANRGRIDVVLVAECGERLLSLTPDVALVLGARLVQKGLENVNFQD